jgi:hypothetical protein
VDGQQQQQQQQHVAAPSATQHAMHAQPPSRVAVSSSGTSRAALEPDAILMTAGPSGGDNLQRWEDCVAHVASGARRWFLLAADRCPSMYVRRQEIKLCPAFMCLVLAGTHL